MVCVLSLMVVVELIMNNGFCFMNLVWNGIIVNGVLFYVNWDKNFYDVEKDLGVFWMLYFDDGIIVYKFVVDFMGKIYNVVFYRVVLGVNSF